MRLLLGSGGFRTETRVAFLADQMRDFFAGVGRLLFVPYALADHDKYVDMIREKGLDAGFALDGIHNHPDPVEAVREAEAIFVGGGNTFRLVDALHGKKLLPIVRERVRQGMPYMGVSAGTNVACPTLNTTNDMPIVMPPGFDTFGLIPFQINPHYFAGQAHVKVKENTYQEHFGETRDDRIREYHEMNDLPVVGLWEGGVLRREGDKLTLHGASARIFRRGKEPQDVEPVADLSGLLAG